LSLRYVEHPLSMPTDDRLPRNLAVPCSCGAAVPLVLFVADGNPHDDARCVNCGKRIFLSRPPTVVPVLNRRSA
jgi:hypothetical protein